eukprot:CAMPEP_0116059166 /NCGR_PEP_ID=MMETSP0322-20121206/5636_1 /TAXON_ID=163516 /ORGANISM="Leptocylindrus danicus var. apora, Strain B651" /LENGTH=472 /DNA_ID=CAMNT_0003543499 /DNA_START=102 /DNA_END=1517 /DNA_ORIENTATION=+
MRQFALKKNLRRASCFVCECNEIRLRRYFSDRGKKFVFFTEKSGRDSPSVRSYSKNGGIVEGVWIFHRHGDRTPSRSLLAAGEESEKEGDMWKTKLPDEKFLEALNLNFPPDVHESQGEGFLDISRYPYGFLTGLGCSQMKRVGQKLSLRYRARPRISGNSAVIASDFLDQWNLSVFSTNYLRTVTSGQCLLLGLLGDSPQDKITVKVRSRKVDTLNAFDKDPAFMMSLVTDVISSPHFQTKDAVAAPLAARLANYLPGLTKPTKIGGGPSGINWIHATDHFVCRAAHKIQFTNLDTYDKNAQPELQEFALPALAHLAWRFRQWYKSPPLLEAIAYPPLKEMVGELTEVPLKPSIERRPFNVFSCHDVTVLALLYAIGAKIVYDETSTYWPVYATTLTFELVKVEKGEGMDSYAVRILLNGEPVELVSRVNSSLRVDEFVNIVEGLKSSTNATNNDEASDVKRSRSEVLSGW